jgi:D-sedoheptulose 7-phosphate isomerase
MTGHFEASRDALAQAAGDATLLATAQAIADAITRALKSGGKLLLIGNGGSAADAQHIAAEFVGRYKMERPGYAAIALTTDSSALTSIANDYGFEQIFARQVEALGVKGDVLVALSTSGRSPNILAALQTARARGLVTIGFTGTKGDAMRAACDQLFVAPSDDTPVIQQIHMVALHAICAVVERALAS